MGTPIYSREELEAAIVAADQAGDDETVKTLVDELKSRNYRSGENIRKRSGNIPSKVQGFQTGMMDLPLGLGQLAINTMGAMSPSESDDGPMSMGDLLRPVSHGVNDLIQNRENEYQGMRDNPQELDIPRLMGNALSGVAMSYALPAGLSTRATGGNWLTRVLANRAKDTATGAAYGVSMPVTDSVESGDYLDRKLEQAQVGGSGGMLGGVLMAPFARVVSPAVSSDIQELRSMGVTPILGQRLGGAFRRAEEGLRSIPGLGDAIANSERAAIRDLNRGMGNRVLSHVSEKIPKDVKVGHEMIDYVGSKLSSKYDSLLPNLHGELDKPFTNQLTRITQMVDNLPDAQRSQFDRILKNKLYGKFTSSGRASGKTLKEIESELGRLATGYHRSPDFDQVQLGDSLREVQNSLRQMINRVNPQYRDQLQPINRAWREFLILENAAARSGKTEGVFSPSALRTSSKVMDSSKHKRKFAKGKANLQREAQLADRILGNRLADSGTAYRSMMGLGLLGGGYTLGGPPVLATQLAASVPYLPGGRQAIDLLFSGGMGFRRPLGKLMSRSAPLLGLSPLSAAAQEIVDNKLKNFDEDWK